ncbi:hypothetical protein BCR44DRAFT_1427937 [Catenaria anguillulae PL171]|uniref:Uncharacterized protein n=1 Tax=Catenaria anguillulae PL171 TaxID=765915 RepID=A0A1Y2HYP7_9FUNG|nr:hypothetical protein BCR44DRAFT_1427937 [Catenaria anguillulae PL171]
MSPACLAPASLVADAAAASDPAAVLLDDAPESSLRPDFAAGLTFLPSFSACSRFSIRFCWCLAAMALTAERLA